MPKYKNTRDGNKKKNIALQKKQQQEEFKKNAQEHIHSFFVRESSIDEMNVWAKRVNAKFFRYYNQNMIVGKMGDPKTDRYVQKHLKKVGHPDKRELEGIECDGADYVVRTEYFKKFQIDFVDMVEITTATNDENIRELVEQLKEAILKLIITPPKITGELGDWSIGNAGSIWIDIEVFGERKRLAFYNQDKDGDICKMYKVDDFNPKFCLG